MENNKIYVKNVESNGDSLKIILSIFDSNLPEFTTGSIIVPPEIHPETGSIITLETIKEIQIPRFETNRIISIPTNYPIGHIEDLIKKERDFFNENKEEVKEKINYFKNKTY